jgi:alpha-glucosidase
MNQLWPVSEPPDELVYAMQTGDRLGYHPERAAEEIAHFHEALLKAQSAVGAIDANFSERLEAYAKRLTASNWRPASVDMQAQKQHRVEAMAKAKQQVAEAGK